MIKLTRRAFLKLAVSCGVSKQLSSLGRVFGDTVIPPQTWQFPLAFPANFITREERNRMKRPYRQYLPLIKNG